MRALVIEGGGMKAAYANGVVSAFEEAGYGPWDAVVGTSAGGAMGAWYSAGQAVYAEGTWKYASHPRILSYKRLLHPTKPVLDHDELLSWVYEQEHPMDVDAVRRAPWEVIVTAADVDTGEVVYPDIRDKDVLAWLKATGRLPFGSGGPVEIDGRRYVDGGVLDPVPVEWTVEEHGATDVTFVSNNAPGPRRADPKLLVEFAARRYPAFRDGLYAHQDLKDHAYRVAAAPPAGVRIDTIAPARPTGVSRMSRDQEAIQGAIKQGRADGAAYLKRRDD